MCFCYTVTNKLTHLQREIIAGRSRTRTWYSIPSSVVACDPEADVWSRRCNDCTASYTVAVRLFAVHTAVAFLRATPWPSLDLLTPDLVTRSSSHVPKDTDVTVRLVQSTARQKSTCYHITVRDWKSEIDWNWDFWPLGAMSLKFRRDFWRRKTRVPGLSYGIFSVILYV